MVALVVGMLISLALAVAVVALVAIPARREGRSLLTPRGEEVVSAIAERTGGRAEPAPESPEPAAGATPAADPSSTRPA